MTPTPQSGERPASPILPDGRATSRSINLTRLGFGEECDRLPRRVEDRILEVLVVVHGDDAQAEVCRHPRPLPAETLTAGNHKLRETLTAGAGRLFAALRAIPSWERPEGARVEGVRVELEYLYLGKPVLFIPRVRKRS